MNMVQTLPAQTKIVPAQVPPPHHHSVVHESNRVVCEESDRDRLVPQLASTNAAYPWMAWLVSLAERAPSWIGD
jgi:hypothetical protein